MNVKYFTSAQNITDFDEFQKCWTLPLNTSNQVFHNRLIRSLALSNKVEVFSCRPFDKKICTTPSFPESRREEKNVIWHYGPIVGTSVKNYWAQRKIALSKNEIFKADVVFADVLNIKCLELAKSYAKKHKIPLVGVITDNPNFIQGTNAFTKKAISSLAKKCDYYICITHTLNKLVNPKNKPCLQIDGITDDMFREVDVDLKPYKRYFFFAGALSERYGVYKLIEAFNQLKRKDISLVLCGYKKEDRLDEAIKDSNNIFYIGTIPNQTCLMFESNSIANINPRIYDRELDKYTVPSKTIEYLSATSLTISTYIKNLYPDFRTSALWVDDDFSLYEALEAALRMTQAQRESMIMNANNTAHEKYSIKANNKKLDRFLIPLLRK